MQLCQLANINCVIPLDLKDRNFHFRKCKLCYPIGNNYKIGNVIRFILYKFKICYPQNSKYELPSQK